MPAFSFDDTPAYKSRKILFKLIMERGERIEKMRSKEKATA